MGADRHSVLGRRSCSVTGKCLRVPGPRQPRAARHWRGKATAAGHLTLLGPAGRDPPLLGSLLGFFLLPASRALGGQTEPSPTDPRDLRVSLQGRSAHCGISSLPPHPSLFRALGEVAAPRLLRREYFGNVLCGRRKPSGAGWGAVVGVFGVQSSQERGLGGHRACHRACLPLRLPFPPHKAGLWGPESGWRRTKGA